MATSGWQNEQWIHTIQAEIYFNGNVRIDGITHSGSNLRVWGTIAFCARGTSGWSGYFNAGVYAAAVNQPDGQILGNGQRLYVGTDVYRDFDVTIGGVSPATTSYNFGVRYHSEYFDKTLYWGLSFNASGTQPTGLTVVLGDVGPDWADIDVSISSYGSPATSANRYIEAAVLGSSSYGSPYRYKTATAVTSSTLHVDNSNSGTLTIAPNTTYHYGGYATNTVMSTSTVAGQLTTLPATPVISAVDQGHGVIDVTVTHANEGSALSVTEEYSIDGGSTWTTITGGAFTLNLSAQTVVTVRRSSSAGSSQDTVTVTPTFAVGIYASVINQSKSVEKVYAPIMAPKLVSASITPSQYTTALDSEKFVDIFTGIEAFRKEIMQGATLAQLTLDWAAAQVVITITLSNGHIARVVAKSIASLSTRYGITATRPSSDTDTVALTGVYETASLSKKIVKIYASVNGKTALTFEDPS